MSAGTGKLEADVATLTRTVDHLSRELEAVTGLAKLAARAKGAGGDDDDAEGGPVFVDAVWACVKCGSRLGLYDPQTEVMRIRRGDLFLKFFAGKGGWLQVICRQCGEENVADYTPEGGGTEPAATGG